MYAVYKITNLIDKKIYVGQTTEALSQRFRRHCGYQLKDNSRLHKAIKIYGKDNFVIEMLDTATDQDELNEKEYYWIQKLRACDTLIGYNIKSSIGKCGGDTLSTHPNKDNIRIKLSESKKGSKNHKAKKVIAVDIIQNIAFVFDSFSDCQKKLNIPRHDIIGKRCRNVIKKPYLNRWEFAYID